MAKIYVVVSSFLIPPVVEIFSDSTAANRFALQYKMNHGPTLYVRPRELRDAFDLEVDEHKAHYEFTPTLQFRATCSCGSTWVHSVSEERDEMMATLQAHSMYGKHKPTETL